MPEFDGGPGRWIRTLKDTESSRALVCFPYGGAPASSYRNLAQSLSYRDAILSVQYPGRQDRGAEPKCETIDELAHGVADALKDSGLESAVFFGHCMGALVAFETARLLGAGGLDLEALIVSGVQAPNLIGADLRNSTDERIRQDVGAFGGTDSRILADPAMMEVFLPALRADYQAVDRYTYVPSRALTCPILALHGSHDPRVTEFGIAGWREFTSAAFGTRSFPGEHFYFVEDPAELASAIDEFCATSVATLATPEGATEGGR